MSWPTVALGEIFQIARGGSPRPIDDYITDDADGVNWVSIRDASNSSKFITKTDKKIRPAGVSKSRMVYPGDFLLTNSMSFGRPYILQTTGCIHDGWLVLSSDKSVVDQDFFYHLLGSEFVYKKFAQLAAGAVVKNLNCDLVKTVQVPLPPLPEQRRIAAILDKADALRAKRREAIAKLDQLLQAVFLDMFGDPVTNPKGWPRVTFGELIKVKSGDGLTAQNMKADGRHPVYGGNGISGYHDEFMFEEPQIIIGRVGVYCGVVHRTKPQAWVTDNALYVSTMLRPMNQTFLKAILTAANFNQYAGRAAQPLVSGSRIYPVETICPPLDLQEEYDRRVRSVSDRSLQMDAHSSLIAKLFSSLQDWAFSGT